MKKWMLVLCSLLVVGCAANPVVNEEDKKSVVVAVEPTIGEKEVLDALAELKYDHDFDYTDKECCFHSRGIWQSGCYWVEVMSDPHDYNVYYLMVGEKKEDDVEYLDTYYLSDEKFVELKDYMEARGFVWDELNEDNQQFDIISVIE